MEQEEKEYVFSKINTKTWYRVYKNSNKGRDYYNILVNQKDFNGENKTYYKNVTFKRGLTLPKDSDSIRIKKAVENYYGESKFKPESSFTIIDYEVKKPKETMEQEAYDEYNNFLDNNEELVEISDDFLD